MEECIFCKIIKGEIPSTKIYEDEDILAFEDINPIAPIHILIIPKKHIESTNELQEEDKLLIGKIFITIRNIAEKQKIKESGYRVVCNCGENAGQEVKHLHFHILGRKTDATNKLKLVSRSFGKNPMIYNSLVKPKF